MARLTLAQSILVIEISSEITTGSLNFSCRIQNPLAKSFLELTFVLQGCKLHDFPPLLIAK